MTIRARRNFILALAAALALLSNQASAVTYTWDGSDGAGWNTAANWVGGVAPVSSNTTDIIISGTVNVANMFSGGAAGVSYTIKSLTFDASNDADTRFLMQTTANANQLARNLTFSSDSGNATLTVESGSTGNKTIDRNGTSNAATIILASSLDVIHNGSGLLTLGNATNASVTGAGGINKSGTGTLVLAGANTYTGTTTINEGVLQVTNGAAIANTNTVSLSNNAGATFLVSTSETIGSLRGGGGTGGNVSIASGSTLTVAETGSQTFSGVISNAGGLTKSGTGTLTLSGANTYTGATTISGGELALSGSGQLSASSALDLSGATARLNISGISAAGSTNASLAGVAGSVVNLGSKNLEVGGANTSTTFAGVLTNTGSLTKSGNGTLTLSGANSYSGGTLVSGGVLSGDTTSLQGAITNDATVSFDQSTSGTYAGAMSGTGALIKTSAGTLTLSGSNSYTGATTLSTGTVALGNANALAGGGTIAFTGGTLQYSASNTADYSARITNSTSAVKIDTAGQNVTWASALNSTAASGGLTKEGAGTLVLNKGTSIFGGALTVNEGTLRVNNTQALNTAYITTFNSVTTINNGSTLIFTRSGTEGRTKFAGGVTFGASGGNTLAINTPGDNGGSSLIQGSYTFTTLGGTTNYITASSGAYFNMQGGAGRYAIFDVADGTGATDLQVDMAVADGGIMKKGAGVLTLTKDNTSITNLVISNGTLELAGAGRLNSGTFAVDISNNGTFVYSGTNNQTLSGAMSGTGDLVKNGNATLTLSGANTYSGGSTLSAGVLRVAHNSALGTGALSASSGATLELTNGITVANNMSVYTVRFLDGGNTLSGTITNNNSLYSVPAGTTNTVSGFITGTGGLELDGGGVLAVTGTTNNYTGDTVITNGTLRITALANSNTASSVGSGSSITLAGTNGAASAVLDYTGGNVSTDRILVLTNGGGTITMASSATEMTLTGSASGSGTLVLGEGTLILSNASTSNSFAPASIQVDSGATLQLAANNQIGDSTGLILNGGTFLVGTASTGFSDTLGTLTLSASSTIDLGAWTTGVRQLTFANSSAITWTGTLTITNWQGVANTSSDVAEILFGTGGLTPGQLSQVYWANQNINGGTLIGGNGELAPIPEARVVWGAAALTAFVLWRERRHFPKLARGLLRRRL